MKYFLTEVSNDTFLQYEPKNISLKLSQLQLDQFFIVSSFFVPLFGLLEVISLYSATFHGQQITSTNQSSIYYLILTLP